MDNILDVSNLFVKPQLGISRALKEGELKPLGLPTGLQAESCGAVGGSDGERANRAAESAARHARAEALVPLSLSNHHNSTENTQKSDHNYKKNKLKNIKNNYEINLETEKIQLTGSQLKTAYALERNVEAFCKKHGVDTVGLFTLTFRENIRDFKEAQRRFNIMSTHYIRPRFSEYVCVVELQDRGAVHYHLIISCGEDIRTGFDFEAVKNRDYRSASANLRRLWRESGAAGLKYGFGRTEIRPIRTTSEGVARYLAKYLSKDLAGHDDELALKGARVVRYSKGFRKANSQITLLNDGSLKWRKKLANIAYHTNIKHEDMTKDFGPRWAYNLSNLYDEYGLWESIIDGKLAALLVSWLVRAGRNQRNYKRKTINTGRIFAAV